MFDAGAIVFSIRAAGAQVFDQELRKADQSVKALGSSTQDAASKTSELGAKQDKTTEQTRKQQKAQQDAAKTAAEYSAAQEKVGAVLVTAGAALVATTALTVRSAIQWESSWAGVTKTVDGTAEELAEVEGGLRGLTSVLPGSHDEIAVVAEAAGQLGVETPNVVAFTRTMIDLGETTNLSANDAATALARFMNVMGTAQSEVSNLGSSVVELGNNYATTEAEIVNMATRLSGAARQVGLTEGETLGLATALSSVGIEAEAGGSAVSKVMIDIAASVDAGGDRVEQFAKVAGISAQEFTKQWKTDPGAALALFVQGLADAEAQGSSTLGILAELGITETRMRDALLRAAAASDEFTAAMDMGNEAYADNNALQAEAAKRYETVESQLSIMRNRINDAAIDLGSVFLPTIADAAGAIGDFADGIASLPAPLQEAVSFGGLAIGMIALLGGTAMIAVPKVIALWTQITALTAANTAMGGALRGTARFMTGPWGVALVAAAAGITLLEKALDSAAASSEEMQNSLTTASSAEQIIGTASEGSMLKYWRDTANELDDLSGMLDQSIAQWENLFLRLTPTGADTSAAERTLAGIGEELATLSQTNLPAAREAFSLLAAETDGSERQLWALLSLMPEYKDALTEVAAQQGINVTSADEAANKTALLELAQEQGAEQSESAARAYLDAADGADQLRQDLDELIDLLNEQNNIGQDAITTNIDYQNTLADVDAQIQQARDGVEGYALTLDRGTQAGRDNMGMLVDLAKDAWDAAEAQFQLDGNTDAFRATLESSRQALLDRIHDLGVSGDEAEALADQIMNIPDSTEWEIIAETAGAQQAIDRLVINNSSRKIVITADVNYQQTGGFTVTPNADGNFIESYANGGIREDHVAQMARAGAYRLWAEPETGGESYIPHALSKRPRSEAILAETASIFGGVYIPAGAQNFADGGMLGQPSTATPEIRVVVQSKGGIDLLEYIDVKVEAHDAEAESRVRRRVTGR